MIVRAETPTFDTLYAELPQPSSAFLLFFADLIIRKQSIDDSFFIYQKTYSTNSRMSEDRSSTVRFGSESRWRSFSLGILAKWPQELDMLTTLACGRNRSNKPSHTFSVPK